MLHLLDQSPDQWQAWCSARGLPAYRAAQVRQWLFRRRATSFAQMTDLPQTFRDLLAGEFQIWTAHVAAGQKAGDGSEKLLLELADGQRIECVLLRNDRRHCAVCISTQVGCGMGCVFCASGLEGVARNLTAGEIIEQILQLQQLLSPQERLSHIVVMGMGEPLANLDAVLEALAVVTAPDALEIGARRVTISTVGLPGGIRRLAQRNCQYHLAVSLHAADDELRNRLIPANRQIGIAVVLAATDEYFEKTGRRVTFEYTLLAAVNDRVEHARRLATLLKGRPALVNLIPYNPVPDLPYRRPSPQAVARFVAAATAGGLNVVVRHRKGERIDGACGQLRRRPL
ncbi:MAG: 23S rRNA (adenine(2503)-C(2))-methyltransferase RlmN [Thermoguttaceae bacterium]|jgi:23S rRNA (adenine2503-C2)-methyltransferase